MKCHFRIFIISLITTLCLLLGAGKDSCQKKPATNNTDHTNPDHQTITLTVKGMTCQSCTNGLKVRLKSTEGIANAEANLNETNNVKVIYDPKQITKTEIMQVITDMDFVVIPIS